ncbi:hypothetical protein J116_017720 [Streptomyces thermolilacinus SPC6]|uniref:Uncharacterized protein n=1 Tax=Streptomyces thermolilacinus SPC6 TaxID=1306406 RepID=A0A1D3DUN8_9ACTN|nr:hypothetical protein J116_017720 [Streptomyces thermolilacinus SPC6]
MRAVAVGSVLAVVFTLSGCVLTRTPRSPYFGFRMDPAGQLVVAYPLCPAREVYGAEMYVEAPGGFRTVWRAAGPVSDEVRSGVFVARRWDGFLREDQPLRGGLPDGFHVDVTEMVNGKPDGDEGRHQRPSALRQSEPRAMSLVAGLPAPPASAQGRPGARARGGRRVALSTR